MARIKYIRVSSMTQNTARQEQDITSYDKPFIEKVSGKDMNRPQLKAMLDYIREGDVVVVDSISRLARSTRDLLQIVEQITAKKAEFVSLKENIDTHTPQGKFMLTVFAAMSELERAQILERQQEGIEIAKREGRMGRPAINPSAKFTEIVKSWRAGNITAVEAMQQAGLKKATFYRKVKELDKATQTQTQQQPTT